MRINARAQNVLHHNRAEVNLIETMCWWICIEFYYLSTRLFTARSTSIVG